MSARLRLETFKKFGQHAKHAGSLTYYVKSQTTDLLHKLCSDAVLKLSAMLYFDFLVGLVHYLMRFLPHFILP